MATRFSNGPEKNNLTRRPAASERKTSLEKEKDHYRSLVENVAVVLWKAPYNSFQYSYVSPEAEKIFGYTQEECLKPDFLEKIIILEEREWVKEYTRLAVQENHTYQIEYHIVTKKGKVKTLRDTVRLLYKDGKPYEKIGTTADISAYSQTLDELDASNRKFFSAFYFFPVPATIFRKKDGKCLDVNKNFLQLTGISRNDIIGKLPWEMNEWINPDEREYLINKLKRNIHLDKFPVLFQDAFSRTRNVLVSSESFEIEGEDCVLLMFHDITDQIKTEKRLQQANRELEIFMYKSSHNLKGPLASIKGLLYLMGKNQMDPQAKQYLHLMEKSAEGMENTLVDLLDIARLKQGNLKIEKVNLEIVLDKIKNRLRFMPEWQEVSLELSLQQKYPLYSDEALLYSVLQNLVENAVKYQAENKKSVIKIKGKIQSKSIEIEVKDNGIGIPLEQQERVFEMFHRAHQKAAGTGLGLYIVRNSVEKLGGKITLESQPGVGSVFTIQIPNLYFEHSTLK